MNNRINIQKNKVLLVVENESKVLTQELISELHHQGFHRLPIISTNPKYENCCDKDTIYMKEEELLKEIATDKIIVSGIRNESFYGISKSKIEDVTMKKDEFFYLLVTNDDAVKLKKYDSSLFVFLYAVEFYDWKKTVFDDEMIDIYVYGADVKKLDDVVDKCKSLMNCKLSNEEKQLDKYNNPGRILDYEWKKAIEEIMERIGEDSSYQYECDTSELSKVILIEMLIEKELKIYGLSYTCMKKDDSSIYLVDVDWELSFKIVIDTHRKRACDEVISKIEIEIYLKRKLFFTSDQQKSEFYILLDTINKTYYDGAIRTVCSKEGIDGVIATRGAAMMYPFININEQIHGLLDWIANMCRDMNDIREYLKNNTLLEKEIEKRQYLWLRR